MASLEHRQPENLSISCTSSLNLYEIHDDGLHICIIPLVIYLLGQITCTSSDSTHCCKKIVENEISELILKIQRISTFIFFFEASDDQFNSQKVCTLICHLTHGFKQASKSYDSLTRNQHVSTNVTPNSK